MSIRDVIPGPKKQRRFLVAVALLILIRFYILLNFFQKIQALMR
jgi:hypothetical protein